jgi:glycosyltransferase involved in cell wall biosynthesis
MIHGPKAGGRSQSKILLFQENIVPITGADAVIPTPPATKPLVSILITYYNAGPYIREAVESACRQTYSPVEVIVIDDGSPDPCAPHLAGLDGFKLVWQPNAGGAAARNAAARNAHGQYLLFVDGDDRLLPTAVETQVAALESAPHAGLVFGAVQRVNQHGDLIRGVHVCRPRRDYFKMLLESSPFECMASAMIRQTEFAAVGGFDEVTKNLIPADDYDIYLRLAHRSPVVRNTNCVIEYRQHTNNISADKEMMLSRIFTVLGKLESSTPLTARQRRRIRHGRRRWTHAFRRSNSLAWKTAELYYRLIAMLSVPVQSYFR